METLELIAALVANWWGDWVTSRKEQTARSIYQQLISATGEIAKVVNQLGNEHKPNLAPFYTEAINAVFTEIDGVPYVTVRRMKGLQRYEIEAFKLRDGLRLGESNSGEHSLIADMAREHPPQVRVEDLI